MSDHDHLEPLPDPTPRNMAGMVWVGLFFGVVAVLIDVWITQGLLGFENPYVIFSLSVMAVFTISGALRDDSLAMILAMLTGVVLGVLITNLLRVKLFDQPSLLAGIGL